VRADLVPDDRWERVAPLLPPAQVAVVQEDLDVGEVPEAGGDAFVAGGRGVVRTTRSQGVGPSRTNSLGLVPARADMACVGQARYTRVPMGSTAGADRLV
jgi:hypothetical protein